MVEQAVITAKCELHGPCQSDARHTDGSSTPLVDASGRCNGMAFEPTSSHACPSRARDGVVDRNVGRERRQHLSRGRIRETGLESCFRRVRGGSPCAGECHLSSHEVVCRRTAMASSRFFVDQGSLEYHTVVRCCLEGTRGTAACVMQQPEGVHVKRGVGGRSCRVQARRKRRGRTRAGFVHLLRPTHPSLYDISSPESRQSVPTC